MKRIRAQCLTVGILVLSIAVIGRAKDLVIHAGTLIDGVADAPRRQVADPLRYRSCLGRDCFRPPDAAARVYVKGGMVYLRNGVESVPAQK